VTGAGRLALVTALVAATIAVRCDAQQRDTTAADTTRPFVRGGIYDKPFLTRLAGRAAIGGYAEAHARYVREDGAKTEAGFVAKRFNLFANALVSEIVRFAAELEFEEGGEEIKLEFAAIDVRVHPAFTIRGGMILSPLGRFNLAHDSPLNEFTDRPLASTEITGVALSEPGLGALGQIPAGPSGRLTYEAYFTNGLHDGLIGDSEDGTRLPLGRGNHEDNNSEPAFVGRLAWSPRIGTEFGVSTHRGAYNVFSEDGLDLDERRSVGVWVADAEMTIAGTTFAGEFVQARIDVPEGLRGIFAERQRGWYAEVVRPFGRGWVQTLPNSTFALKVRGDGVDFDSGLDGDDTRQISAGVNFRPGEDTVLKLDYVRGRSRDRFAVPGDYARLLFSLATYF
jgi:hypothetical protein